MVTKILPLLVLAVFIWGCSNDEPTPPIEEASTVPDFIALGEDLENVYLYSYHAMDETEEVANLTESNSVDRFFLTLRQNGDVLTFYSFLSGSFSATQYNVRSGETRQLDNVFNVSDEHSIIWGTNSPGKLFFGFYSPRESTNYGMRSIDITSGDITDISLEANVQNVYEPLYVAGKVFMTYRASTGDYRMAVIEAETSRILQIWEFGTATPSLFIDGAGDIVLITGRGGTDFIQTIYDFDTLEKLEETSFSLPQVFAPGPLQANLVNDKFYYLNFYAQPSAVPFGPAVYDFFSGENRIIDMIGIVESLEQEEEATITITAYRYLPAGNAFLFGYTRNFNDGNFQGGVLVISRQGELIRKFPTPFIPVYIIDK